MFSEHKIQFENDSTLEVKRHWTLKAVNIFGLHDKYFGARYGLKALNSQLIVAIQAKNKHS